MNQSSDLKMKIKGIKRPLLKDKVNKGGVNNFIRDNHHSGTKISSMEIGFVVLVLVIKL